PDYAKNGFLYTFTSEPVNGPADFSTMPPGTIPNCQSVVAEWHVPNPQNPASVVDPNSVRVLLRIDKPQFNHNGGCLNFGPDEMLYISIGDGGGADDQDGTPFIGGPTVGHGPNGNGQNTQVALGKLFRIDPRGSNSANGQYGVPDDNPFVGQPDFLPEIYAYGFRNPWRFSFDRLTGALYVGDVGQNAIEEVDIVVPGGNYGWRIKEGSFLFDPNGPAPGFVTANSPGVPAGLIDPIAEYDHDEGLSVIGGFVYRGAAIPWLHGRYVFGDFARTFNNDGRLFFLQGANHHIFEFHLAGQAPLGLSVLGTGQDAAGELYVLANSTGVPFGTSGVVLRIARGQGPPGAP
ncbi:MAG TPA: PQQ-dependent sugar dehydrogenase, partial [Phycisphaerae bacterium]